MKAQMRVKTTALVLLAISCIAFGLVGCTSRAQVQKEELGKWSAPAIAKSDQSIVWAGNEVTGIIQLPSDWMVLGPVYDLYSDVSYHYMYQGPNAETLKIIIQKGTLDHVALPGGLANRESVSLNGHNAVRLTSDEQRNPQKLVFLIDRPGGGNGENHVSQFEFTFEGEEPPWIEQSMSSLLYSNSDERGVIALTNESTGIGESQTQWAGYEEAGYVSIANDWTPTFSSNRELEYYIAPPDSKGEEAWRGAHLTIGTVNIRGCVLGETIVREHVNNAKQLTIDDVSVNGIDGSLATGLVDLAGSEGHFFMYFLDNPESHDGTTLITIWYYDGHEVDVNQILETYVR